MAAGIACSRLPDKGAFTVFAKAYKTFTERWLRIGNDWFQAYEIRGSGRHPLLPQPKDTGTINGFVWASGVSCRAKLEDKKKGIWSARLTAKSIRFSEDGNPWTAPFKDGAMWEVFLAKEEGKWIFDDNSVDVSILSPDSADRKPKPEELPPR